MRTATVREELLLEELRLAEAEQQRVDEHQRTCRRLVEAAIGSNAGLIAPLGVVTWKADKNGTRVFRTNWKATRRSEHDDDSGDGEDSNATGGAEAVQRHSKLHRVPARCAGGSHSEAPQRRPADEGGAELHSQDAEASGCSTSSLMGCIITAAELGLEPGGALGHAYLVPFKGQCTLIIGYRGFVDLMRRSGQLSTIRAVVVHEKDEFTIKEGLEQVIEHRPFLTGDPGLLRFVYAVAKLKDGSYQSGLHDAGAGGRHQARSRSSSDGPWVTDYEEMAKKTVIRRIASCCPSPETRDAVEKDDEDHIDAEVTSSVVEEAVSVTDPVKAKMAARRKTLVIQDGTQTPAVAETPGTGVRALRRAA